MHETRSRSYRASAIASIAIAALAGSLLAATPASAAVSLSGTVTDQGTPVADVAVELFADIDGYWSYQTSLGTTDPAGTWSYSTATLFDGAYALWYDPTRSPAIYASDQGAGGQTDSRLLATEFTIAGGSPSTGTFSETLVHNAGAVQFNAVNASDGTPISGVSGYVSVEEGIDATGNSAAGNYRSYPSLASTTVLGGILPGSSFTWAVTASGHNTAAGGGVNVSANTTTDLGTISLAASATPSMYSVLSQPKAITVSGVPKVGALLTANAPTAPAGSTRSFQWFTDGVPIPGAQAPTFVPTADEQGTSLAVRVYYALTGYSSDYVSSEASKRVAVGDPNQALVTIVGAAKFGLTVRAAVAGSTIADTRTQYQWYRSGTPVPGEDGSSYAITKSDIGKSIRVAVTSFAQGHTDTVIPSAEVVAKDVPALTVEADKSIKTTKKLKVVVTVKPGKSKVAATGTATVFYSSTKYKTITFTGHAVKKTVLLPKLTKGKHTITVRFDSTRYVTRSKSIHVKVSKGRSA